MAKNLSIQVSADVRQALQSLSGFSNEIDRAGGVTEAMAKRIADALNVAVSGFTDLKNVKVSNPFQGDIARSADNIATSVQNLSGVFTTTQGLTVQAGLSWNQFVSVLKGPTKAAVKEATGDILSCGDATKLLGQEWQKYKEAGLSASAANQKIAQSFTAIKDVQPTIQTPKLDFANQIEAAKARVSESVDQMVNEALGLNKAFGSISGEQFKVLQSAFVDTEKPVDQLRAEILTLRDAIGETTNPIVLERFGSQLSKLQAQLSQKITPTVSFSTAQINTPFIQPKINTADLKDLQVQALTDVQSIEKLNREIINVGIALDKAVAAKSPLIGSLKAEFDALVSTVTKTEAEAFNTAFIDSASKSINQLENEITVLKSKIDKDLTDPAQIDRFASRITVLQEQLSNLRFGGINLDTSKLSALQSAFVNTIKPVEQLEIEIEALNAAIKSGANPAQLQAFNAQLKKLETQLENTRIGNFEGSLNKINQSATRAADGLKRVPGASNSASLALLNLGRVAQDAPFGFLGISNNLNPLLESFQRLQKETGSTGATLKALGRDLLGGGGLGLAVSVVSSLMILFGDKLFKSGQQAEEAKEKVDSYADGIKEAFSSLAQEAAKVDILVNALRNEKLSRSERNEAIKELQQIAPAYFGTLDKEKFTVDQLVVAYGNYARSLRTAAEAKGLEKQLDKIIERKFEIDQILNPPQFSYDEQGRKIQNVVLLTAKSIKERNQLQSEYNGLLKGEEVLARRIAQLKPPDLIKPATDLNKGGGTAEKKFQFLFDFLPFNPDGTMKPEQRAHLIDAIDKFQKDFGGILQGALFTGDTTNRIAQAKKLDLEIKAGRVRFDGKGVTDKIKEELNKVKDEDIMPKYKLQEISDLVVQQYIRAFDVTTNDFKDFKLPLPSVEGTLADAKLEMQRIGKQLPKVFAAKDVFGNPVELKLDELLDFTKISPADAIKAIQEAIAKIKQKDKSLADEIEEDLRAQGIRVTKAGVELGVAISESLQKAAQIGFVGFGEAIGQAIAGANFMDAFQTIFASLGGVIKQLGTEMVALSPIIRALRAAIRSLSPGAILAAGVGLVALGTIIQSSFNKVRKFSKGGIVPGTGNSDTVPALLTPGELVIPKNKVAEVQKLLQGSTKLQIPTQLLSSLKNIALAGQNFNIPVRRLNTDAIAPLGRAQAQLAGAAGQNVNVTVEGITKGNDIVYQVAKVLRAQNRNFGRGNF